MHLITGIFQRLPLYTCTWCIFFGTGDMCPAHDMKFRWHSEWNASDISSSAFNNKSMFMEWREYFMEPSVTEIYHDESESFWVLPYISEVQNLSFLTWKALSQSDGMSCSQYIGESETLFAMLYDYMESHTRSHVQHQNKTQKNENYKHTNTYKKDFAL